MNVNDYLSTQLEKSTRTFSFEELADYVIKHSNHNTNPDLKQVHIIVLYPFLEWGRYHEQLATLTWFSGIGWNNKGSVDCNVIFTRDLDEALNSADQYDHAMISMTGAFYKSYDDSHPEIIQDYFKEFCESDNVCRGHLLFHPHKKYGRLHLQTMFMDLRHWRKIGRPMVYGDYTGRVMLPERSKGDVHDDYTPFWIKPSNEYTEVKDWHMAEYITKVLEDGKTILNFDMERTCKFFSYPERDYVSEHLLSETERTQHTVYARNNERLSKYLRIPEHDYDVIYAPAAGEMAEFLWDKFGGPNTKLVVYDFNEPSVEWKKKLYSHVVGVEDINRVSNFIAEKHDCWVDDVHYKPDLIEENNELYPLDKWVDTIHRVKDVEFIHCDVVRDMLPVDESKKNLIVFSNIFSYMSLLHTMRVEDIHNSLLRYYDLDNTFVTGKNVFRDSFYNDNICG